MYCGQPCKNQTNNLGPLPFGDLFSADHLWWSDDIGLMQVALAPWHNNLKIKNYLDKISQDRQRVAAIPGVKEQ
jgi:hypothetical protein